MHSTRVHYAADQDGMLGKWVHHTADQRLILCSCHCTHHADSARTRWDSGVHNAADQGWIYYGYDVPVIAKKVIVNNGQLCLQPLPQVVHAIHLDQKHQRLNNTTQHKIVNIGNS